MKLTGNGLTVYTDGDGAPARSKTRFGIVLAHSMANTVLTDKTGGRWYLKVEKTADDITIVTRTLPIKK